MHDADTAAPPDCSTRSSTSTMNGCRLTRSLPAQPSSRAATVHRPTHQGAASSPSPTKHNSADLRRRANDVILDEAEQLQTGSRDSGSRNLTVDDDASGQVRSRFADATSNGGVEDDDGRSRDHLHRPTDGAAATDVRTFRYVFTLVTFLLLHLK